MATPVQASCINKLLLVCFCLDVPVHETFAPLALLMRKRVLPDNIVEIAKLINERLIDCRDRYCRGLKRCAPADEQDTTAAGAKPPSKRKILYPTTIAQLERKLDDLLGCLRAKQHTGWKRLAASGLFEHAVASAKKGRQ
jgi:hypothetical protein